MRYFIITGEPSGDIYGAMLAKEIYKKSPNSSFMGMGGNEMFKEGVEIVKHIKDMSFMGLSQVIINFFNILNTFKLLQKKIKTFKPHTVILIDYGGFNLHMAKWLYKNSFNVIYYIPPKVWAWNQKRILKIKKYVNHVLLIFPFEEKLYKQYNIPCTYIGNPQIDYFKQKIEFDLTLKNKNLITVMPGSRLSEVKIMLPIILKIMNSFLEYQFVIIKSENISDDVYNKIINKHKQKIKNLHLIRNLTKVILKNSVVAIVKSGTSTLQVALSKTPQIVCYKANWFNYFIFKQFIKIKYISLPNIILDKEIIKEMIQSNMNHKKLSKELEILIIDIKTKSYRYTNLIHNYNDLINKLNLKSETASFNAAKKIFEINS